MKIICIKIVNIILKLIYWLIKLLTKEEQIITIISRQSNEASIDIKILERELKNSNPSYKIVVLCKKIEGNLFNKSLYFFHIIKQMYYISKSKIVILDSYCVSISMLNHKKNLIVIQIWHAIGLMKKAGYSILGKNDGRSLDVALAVKMHCNYTYAVASSTDCISSMAKVFNISSKKIKILKLPRIDYLKENKLKIRKQINTDYPELKNKQNILYIPTHRKTNDELEKNIQELINTVDYKNYNLIIKLHPLTNVLINNSNVLYINKYSSIDCLTIADYVITDYSGLAFDAMVIDIPVYFFAFDYESYNESRSMFIDYKKTLPNKYYKEASKLISGINNNDCNMRKQTKFFNEYVDVDAETVIEFINKLLT